MNVPFSPDVVNLILNDDIATATASLLKIFPNAPLFGEVRYNALRNMMFNMGEDTFLGFKSMISSILKGDWQSASSAAENSAWFNQVGSRSVRIVKQLKTGEL
jgi:GH24 family phage-related lysozyme (muramidase)